LYLQENIGIYVFGFITKTIMSKRKQPNTAPKAKAAPAPAVALPKKEKTKPATKFSIQRDNVSEESEESSYTVPLIAGAV